MFVTTNDQIESIILKHELVKLRLDAQFRRYEGNKEESVPRQDVFVDSIIRFFCTTDVIFGVHFAKRVWFVCIAGEIIAQFAGPFYQSFIFRGIYTKQVKTVIKTRLTHLNKLLISLRATFVS